MKRSIVIILLSLGLINGFAQGPQALLQADTNRIRIGEQIKLTLSVFYSNKDKKASIKWPAIPDSLNDGKVIVIDRGPIDTLAMNNEDASAMMQRRNIFITAFDSANYIIGPFSFVVNGDSVRSNDLEIQSITFEVDTTKAIQDIKGVIDVKYGIWDWILENKWLLLIGAGILMVLFVLISLLKRKKKITTVEEVIIDTRTPDEIAQQALESIRIERRWTRVTPKVYYSELTEILRTYIEKRFEVLALEQTTSELMTSLRYSDCPGDERARLNEILSTADLVKFARQQPDEQTALISIDSSLRFVENTRTKTQEQKPNEESG